MTINNLRLNNINLPELKPINKLIENRKSNLLGKDNFKLTNPNELFNKFANQPILNFFNNITPRTSIVEGNVSLETINAVKNIPGNSWVGKLASNGNREVAVIVPDNIDKSKPVEVLYYFHGHHGKISKAIGTDEYSFSQELNQLAKQKNLVIVIPQGPSKSLAHTWMKGSSNEDMKKFQTETLNIIQNKLSNGLNISSISVYGHSAGGQPLMNAAEEGKLTANKITFLDASYGNWSNRTYQSFIKQNPDVKFNVVYIPGSSTQNDALSLENQRGVKLYQSKFNHSLVPKKFINL